MKNAIVVCLGVLFSFGAQAIDLPGEPATKPALVPAAFPDRLSAFVWRNWGLVPVEKIAAVVKAPRAEIVKIAVEMGLCAQPTVLPEWHRRGYITIVRRNWHLLPYSQLTTLLDMSREQLSFSLINDDFLWYKLGTLKPKCDELIWNADEQAHGRSARLHIAQVLAEEGLDPNAPEEPRFSFIPEIAHAKPNFTLPDNSTSPFDFRIIFSYFADYVDPLADPEIGSFPEGLLQKLAAEGVNAVWMHTVLSTLTRDPKYPEFGAGCEARRANLKKLVARAAKYGIRVFLYMNEPRPQTAAFFEVNDERRALKGAADAGMFAFCSSHPETLRYVRDAMRQLFSDVQGLGGIFTISMSENNTHCAARGHKAECPRCAKRKTGDIVVEVNRAMIEGMVAGDSKAEALLYNWAWPEAEQDYIVSRLPAHHCRLMAVSEHGMKICRGGVMEEESDYAISVVGPGESARRLWQSAKAHGMPSVAKVQAGNSWELSTFPYLPVMNLVAQHASNLANEQIGGVMLSWSLGCCPSPNLSVYRELRRGETTPEPLLNRMAKRLYGKKASQARRAWKAFSDGFSQYPFSCSVIYNGPHQLGPANLLYPKKSGYKATMVCYPYDDLDGWRSRYPRETYAKLIGQVADGFAEGCRLMEGVADKRELNMFRAEQMHFAACRDQARFIIARDAGDQASMKHFARAELNRAKAYWPLVRADSRIGFESSNHYFYVPRDILEKVLTCRLVLDAKP